MDDGDGDKWIGWLCVIIVVGVIALALFQPKFEAESYTRLTGKKVNYWDAVWLDLRVQEGVK